MTPRLPVSNRVSWGTGKTPVSSGSRGGIQKRRHNRITIDDDGDLQMDVTEKRVGRSRACEGNGSISAVPNPRGISKAAQTSIQQLRRGNASGLAHRNPDLSANKPMRGRNKPSQIIFLRVDGLKRSTAARNHDRGLNDLLSFLERKAASSEPGKSSRRSLIQKSHLVGDYVFIGISQEDVGRFIVLDGSKFAGTQLTVINSPTDPEQPRKATESKETRELREKLQFVLSQRYHGDTKLLKLNALASDSALVTIGMFETPDRALKTFKGLMAICDGLFKTAVEKRDAIESISLADNSINNVAQVESVATTFPQLKNLDISGNQIESMQALERWRGKFQDLVAIFMTGNPIEIAQPGFENELLEWFPKLQDISGKRMRTADQIEERAAASKPKPIVQSGPDFRDVNGIGEKFLLEFFTMFDNDRQGLASRLYDEGSQFSLAVDTSSIRDSTSTAPLPWSAYIKVSRNLMRINHEHARIQRLFKGGNVIHELWRSLPLTRHPSLTEKLSKYIMDCHPLPGLADPNGQVSAGVDGLILCVHGEFEEFDPKSGGRGMRSFSRTFVLGPGQAGKGPIRVVSDMLSLRAHKALPDVFSPSSPIAAPAAADQNQAVIAELSKQTGMVREYSEMCLSQVGWHLEKALAIFHEKKVELPADAFTLKAC